jgi:putative glutamine amidotransferase
LGLNYIRSLRRAGGVPVALIHGELGEVEIFMPQLRGILLVGGFDDVDAGRYGQAPRYPMESPDPSREELEWKILNWADRVGLPVFGICRGIQALNVFRGGTLIQDLEAQRPDALVHDFKSFHPRNHLAHRIRIDSSSRLASLVGHDELRVNSFHHQAVDVLGRGLRAVAWAEDGIVEGLEDTNPDRFLVGVQFHPEDIVDDVPPLMDLFKGFVEACKAWKPTAGTVGV